MLEHFSNEEVKPYLQVNHLELRMTLIRMTFQLRYDITIQSHAKKREGMTLFGKYYSATHGMTLIAWPSIFNWHDLNNQSHKVPRGMT